MQDFKRVCLLKVQSSSSMLMFSRQCASAERSLQGTLASIESRAHVSLGWAHAWQYFGAADVGCMTADFMQKLIHRTREQAQSQMLHWHLSLQSPLPSQVSGLQRKHSFLFAAITTQAGMRWYMLFQHHHAKHGSIRSDMVSIWSIIRFGSKK